MTLALTVLALAAAVQEDGVAVRHDPQLGNTVYSAVDGDCRIRWEIYSSELNRHVIHQREDCRRPPAEWIPLIRKVMRRVFADAPPDTYSTLYVGRIHPDGKPDPTPAIQLALAAKRSREWNAARGVPARGHVNGWVRATANRIPLYPELRTLFREAGLELEVVSVEKVLVMRASRLPIFDRLPKSEVRPSDRLPYDCQVWFSIKSSGDK